MLQSCSRPAALALLLCSMAFAGHGLLAAQRRPGPPRGTEPPAPAAGQAPAAPADISAPAPGALSPRNASYAIEVQLDPASRSLSGSQVLTWRNIAAIPAAELRFHLYYNAWKNTRSTWMREELLGRAGPGRQPLASRPADDWGWIDVTGIRLLDAGAAPFVDLTEGRRFVAPDDGNGEDQTVLEVPLPRPVAPGETVRLKIDWRSKIPRTFARTGAIGSYFFLAQWFPKIGVLEDAGWNCHQFHAATEFFADFGVYDVAITVPKGWVVGSTGVERGRTDNVDGTTTHRYYQEDVHDFAWTTSPDYLDVRERFEHPSLPPVEMRLLLQPEHSEQVARHFAATRAALRYYGEWYGPYPYGQITIVDPAWQSGAGGMEYPTLFTAGTRWLAPKDVTRPEGVTVHEAGHQFWFGIVANNEFEHAWLDEGFNTFSTARTLAQVFEPHYYSERYFGGFIPLVFRDIPLARATDGNRLSSYRSAAKSDAQSTPTYRYWPGTAGRITYDKTALWLHTLERYLGWPTLQRIMATYFTRWRFRHPKPADFFEVANEVSRRDLTWFFNGVHRGSDVYDYGIEQLSSEPVGGRGLFEEGGRRAFAERRDSGGVFRTHVVVRRYGEGLFPVDVLVKFADGHEERRRWDGRERWTLFTFERLARAVSAQVDPDRILLLDINYTNNSMTLSQRTREAATKWMLNWMIWLQDVLLSYGFFV